MAQIGSLMKVHGKKEKKNASGHMSLEVMQRSANAE